MRDGDHNMNVSEQFNITCDWTFTDLVTGQKYGPFSNAVAPTGAEDVAALLALISSPYLVIGDDTAAGWTMTEVFRKAVSSVVVSGNVVTFTTQLLGTEGNGTVNHEKWSIYTGATAVAGTGRMLNLLRQSFMKTSSMILSVEAEFTVS